MNRDDKTKKSLLETIGLSFVMVLFTLIAIYFAPIALMIFPAAFIVFGIRNGMVQGFITMMITILAIGIIDNYAWTIILFIIFVPIAMAMTYTIKKRMTSSESLGTGAIVFFISIIIILTMVNYMGINFIEQMEAQFREMVALGVEYYEEMGLTSYEIIQSKGILQEGYKSILINMPAVLLVLSLIISYINYSFTVKGLKRMGVQIVNRPIFSRFRLPDNIVPGVGIMLLGTFILMMMEYEFAEAILMNILFVVRFLILIQGISVIDHLLKKRKILFVIRLMLLGSSVLIPLMASIFSLVGIVDIIIDIRKIRKIKS